MSQPHSESVGTSAELVLEIHPESGTGPGRAAELTRILEGELRRLPLERIEHPPATNAPPGAKGTALEWAQLAVTFSGGLPVLIGLVRGWLRRNPECSVTLESGGDRITLTGVGDRRQRQILDRWLKRHGG